MTDEWNVPAELLREVTRLESEMIELTRRLVTVNSYSANVAGVNAVGALLSEAFALPSLERSAASGVDWGEHLFWTTPASGAKILLIGHHDTVFPPGHFEGWSVDGSRVPQKHKKDLGGLCVLPVLSSACPLGRSRCSSTLTRCSFVRTTPCHR